MLAKIWKNCLIRIRQDDRYVCLSDIAKASGKNLNDWLRQKQVKAYIISASTITGIPVIELIEVTSSKPTFAHPKVSLRFAQWCSLELEFQVDSWLDELLTAGSVSIKPKTALELAKEQVKLLEQLELKEQQIKLLEEDNQRQAEAIDELFDYSSIIRVAKYNQCSEKAFSWRKLKAASIALDLERKKVPCPWFEVKNLYHHDVWRYVYISFDMAISGWGVTYTVAFYNRPSENNYVVATNQLTANPEARGYLDTGSGKVVQDVLLFDDWDIAAFSGSALGGGSGGGTLTLKGTHSAFIPAPKDKDYIIQERAPKAYTINNIAAKTVSGTCNITVKINTTNIVGMTNVGITSTQSVNNASSANTVTAGDRLTVEVLNNSSAVDLSFSIEMESIETVSSVHCIDQSLN